MQDFMYILGGCTYLCIFYCQCVYASTGGPSKHRLDNSARIAVFLDRIKLNEYSSIPVNSSECAEPGFTALLDVIEQSRLHSTIVLVTGAPPSDPDMFELVLNLAIIKNIKIYILFNESVCSGDLQMYKVLAQATGGRILDSLDSFVEFYTFRESSNVSVSADLNSLYSETCLIRHSMGLEKNVGLGGCRITEG